MNNPRAMRRAPGCFRFQTLTQIKFNTTFSLGLEQGSLAGMRFIILLLVSGSSLALSQLSVPSPYEPTCCAAGSATGACNWNTCATASCSATGQYSCTTCSQQNGLAYCPPPPGPPTPGTTCFRTGARCDFFSVKTCFFMNSGNCFVVGILVWVSSFFVWFQIVNDTHLYSGRYL